MIDFSKPVKTLSGFEVKILCTNRRGDFPVVALVAAPDGDELVCNYTLEGKGEYDRRSYTYDLTNVPEEMVEYVNYYGSWYKTKEEADDKAFAHRVACLKVKTVNNVVVDVEIVR